MSITVEQLLASSPGEIKVLVGAGVDRPIRWVHPTEMANPSGYLEGGEVILTAGVWIGSGTSAETVVNNLREANVSAIGFGLTERHDEVPPQMVMACRRCELTLFSVPIEVPFLAIMGAFVELVSRERELPLQDAIKRNERLLRAAARDDAFAEIVRVLGRECPSRAWLADSSGKLLAAVGDEPLEEEVSAALGTDAARTVPEGQLFVVGDPRAPNGVLAVAPKSGRLEIADRNVIEQALPFLALAFERERALRETSRRFAAELVDLLLAGDAMADAAEARLEAFGLDPGKPLAVLICAAEGSEEAMEVLDRRLREAGVAGTVTAKRGHAVAMVQWTGTGSEFVEFARETQAELAEIEECAVGFGELVTGVAGLRKSLVEARHACMVASLKEGGGLASYADVGSHRLLLALQEREALEHFREAILRPLDEHDARSQVSLIETLDTFLTSGGKWRDTARTLYIHVNTLRNRLKRVEELTGRDLGSMEDRVDFYVALRAREGVEEPTASLPRNGPLHN